MQRCNFLEERVHVSRVELLIGELLLEGIKLRPELQVAITFLMKLLLLEIVISRMRNVRQISFINDFTDIPLRWTGLSPLWRFNNIRLSLRVNDHTRYAHSYTAQCLFDILRMPQWPQFANSFDQFLKNFIMTVFFEGSRVRSQHSDDLIERILNIR